MTFREQRRIREAQLQHEDDELSEEEERLDVGDDFDKAIDHDHDHVSRTSQKEDLKNQIDLQEIDASVNESRSSKSSNGRKRRSKASATKNETAKTTMNNSEISFEMATPGAEYVPGYATNHAVASSLQTASTSVTTTTTTTTTTAAAAGTEYHDHSCHYESVVEAHLVTVADGESPGASNTTATTTASTIIDAQEVKPIHKQRMFWLLCIIPIMSVFINVIVIVSTLTVLGAGQKNASDTMSTGNADNLVVVNPTESPVAQNDDEIPSHDHGFGAAAGFSPPYDDFTEASSSSSQDPSQNNMVVIICSVLAVLSLVIAVMFCIVYRAQQRRQRQQQQSKQQQHIKKDPSIPYTGNEDPTQSETTIDNGTTETMKNEAEKKIDDAYGDNRKNPDTGDRRVAFLDV